MRKAMLVAAAVALVVTACGNGRSATGGDQAAIQFPGEPIQGDLITLPSGVQYFVLKEGTGPKPAPRQRVFVQYTGYVLSSGKQFDTSLDDPEPFSFLLGMGEVIPGWDDGVAQMRVGGKYKLIIPPELAYRQAGFGDLIPPNAVLVFDIELVKVE